MKIYCLTQLTAPKARFPFRNVSTGPPDAGFNLTDRIETGSRRKVSAGANMVVPRRTRAWLLPPILYWLAASFVIAGSLPAASQSEPREPQLGTKLVGTGAVGPAEQGWSVALSADGNTAIVGGIVDNKLTGAAWVFTRTGSVWTQQGSKLVGADAVGQGGAGSSVALSADGNTAIVGGPFDNSNTGAAWVYSRNGAAWAQQGAKLVGTGAVGRARQGTSVALSADGNTAIVGGPLDNLGAGAAWLFIRSGDTWTQQGSKLVGTGAVDIAHEGASVALSADGNTAIAGGPYDNLNTGAVWVYSRNGTVWAQQGGKLVGVDAVGDAGQGFSVALSADGNTAIIGGFGDDSYRGAAWVYGRRGTVWTQHGNKLVGAGAVGIARQGHSVTLSADGTTAIIGGPYDNSYTGAAWAYRRGPSGWTQQGNKLVGNPVMHAEQGFSVALSADGNTAIAGGIADNRVTGAAWVHSRSEGVWTPTPAPHLGF
jgi:antibiotic biosynthesis monooxygenase (ABM) superfamily enzyme